jgi:hypothetical protein
MPEQVVSSTKRPKNASEGAFWDAAQATGWTVSKRGWPDFICWKDEQLMVVEVKRHRGYRLKRHQTKVMIELAKRGIACYQWTPDGGFQRIVPPSDSPLGT